jgi:hypothetical protein
MSDRDEITALVHRYAELLDSGRLAEVVDLFSRATWRAGSTGAALTPEQIKATYDRVILYDDGTPRTHHLITNLTIDVTEGATEAAGSCYFTVLQGVEPGQPLQAILSGRYTDRYERDEGGWHFAERTFDADLVGDQTRHFRTG